MTMKSPSLDVEDSMRPALSYDPEKSFRFTWPGCPPRVIGGRELSEICRGANVSMLQIEEAPSTASPFSAWHDPNDGQP